MRIRAGVLAVALLIAGCGGGVTGTYTDSTGGIVLVLKSGGQATLTFAGQTGNCTYTANGNNVNLNCQGAANAIALTVQSDGSITGPPDGFMPPLKKK